VFRILALDASGIRAVMTASLLERLEARTPGFLQQVDLFAGASAGGILALMLASGFPPRALIDFYTRRGRDIFSTTWFTRVQGVGNLDNAKYSNANLKRALSEIFGDKRLGDLPKRVLVSCFDLDNEAYDPGAFRTWKVKFFHNFPGEFSLSDANELLADVALRTTATPAYFPAYQGYIDGSVVVANIGACALAQAIHPGTGGQRLREIALLSVSGGFTPRYLAGQEGVDWGVTQWATRLTDILADSQAGMVAYQCEHLLGPQYHHLNPVLTQGVALDEMDQLPYLMEVGRAVELDAAFDWLNRYFSAGAAGRHLEA
jgi:hypothetical protein